MKAGAALWQSERDQKVNRGEMAMMQDAPRFCTPVPSAAGGMGPDELLSRAEEASSFLKKLANRDRLMVVCALVGTELSVRALEDKLSIRQPGLSQQLTELRLAGIIVGRKEGKHMFYRLADPRAEELVAVLCRLFCA